MKNFIYPLVALLLIATSCKNDDDEQGPSNRNPNAGDSFLTYDVIENRSFRMWVGGEEVPTGDLDFGDYLHEDANEYFAPDIIENGNVQFVGDTVIVNLGFVPPNSKFRYRFSNDSLFIIYPWVGESFTAVGTKQSLKMAQGYFYASRTLNESWLWRWQFETFNMNFENIEDELYWDKFSEMSPLDTLVIYNQDLRYKN